VSGSHGPANPCRAAIVRQTNVGRPTQGNAVEG
jgi:hypothetical protein